MENDLVIIDCVEKIRSFLLALDPGIERRRERLLTRRPLFDPVNRIKEIYLAVCLKLDIETAPGRRKAREILRRLSVESLESSSGLSVAEAIAFDFSRVSEKKKSGLKKGLSALEPILKDGRLQRAVESGILKTIPQIQSMPLGLKGIRAYQFLALIGAPVALPESGKRNFLFRLGWLPDPAAKTKHFRLYQELCEKAARLSGESVQSLDFLLGLYSGAIKSPREGLPVCGPSPACEHCRLSHYCYYERYRHDTKGKRRVSAPIPSWLPEERPREKLERLGAYRLSDTEILAIILRTGSRKQTALELARDLLKIFGSLRGIELASIGELCQIPGIGKAKAIELKAAIEAGKRFQQKIIETGSAISDSKQVFNQYKLRFSDAKNEVFMMLVLNSRNRVTKEIEVSRGSLTSSTVHPREVFREAIRESASGVIFVHNHPSGDPSPSRADILITERLKKAGEILGIRFLDHIIIGENRYYSFMDQGL